MVRTYKKKDGGREANRVSAATMRTATMMVIEEGQSVRKVSSDLQIPRTTLTRYVNEAKEKGISNVESFAKTKAHRKVLSDKQEEQLKEYLQICSRQHHGLTEAGQTISI